MTSFFWEENTGILGKRPNYLTVIQVSVWDFDRCFMLWVGSRLCFAPPQPQACATTSNVLASNEDMSDVKYHPRGLGSRWCCQLISLGLQMLWAIKDQCVRRLAMRFHSVLEEHNSIKTPETQSMVGLRQLQFLGARSPA